MATDLKTEHAAKRLLRPVFVLASIGSLLVVGTFHVLNRRESARFQANFIAGDESFKRRDSLIDSYNALGFDVFSRLGKEHPGQNILFSPVSLAESLAMLAEGASGDTRDEIAKTLRLSRSNLNGLAESNALFMKTLAPRDPALALYFANGLWVNQNDVVKSNYVGRVKDYFGAQVEPIDVTSVTAPDTINKWASAHTGGRIPEIVSGPFSRELDMILASTVYFKGEWMSPFDAESTHDAPFTLLDGEVIQCPQMQRLLEAAYCDNPMFQAVQLMFNNGEPWPNPVTMWVLLPKEVSLFSTVLESLTTANWNSWCSKCEFKGGTVALPRFKMKAKYELSESLQASGMRKAFHLEQADFSPISPARMCVSECRQAVALDVNEKGAEATAATEISLSHGTPSASFSMVVNRPFIAVICPGDTILFLAAIVDPR